MPQRVANVAASRFRRVAVLGGPFGVDGGCYEAGYDPVPCPPADGVGILHST